MQDKKQQLEWDMEQLTGSKLGKEYDKAIYCYPAYITYMQSEVKWSEVKPSKVKWSEVKWSRSVVSDSLQPHGV